MLSGVVCLGAGVMNMVPWGGPTVRAMAALKLDSSEVFNPVLPAMGFGDVWVLVASYLLGRRERNRPAALSPKGPATDVREGERDDREPAASATVTATTEQGSSRHATPATADGERQALRAPGDGPGTVRVPPLPRTWLNIFNLLLTIGLVVCLIQEVIPLPVLFVLGSAIALLVNHPTWEQQQALLDKHAKSVVRVTTMIFAAGVLTGILSGTRMIKGMAETLVFVVPDCFGSHLPVAVAVTGVPLSLVFTPDADSACCPYSALHLPLGCHHPGHNRLRSADRCVPHVTGVPGLSGVPTGRGLPAATAHAAQTSNVPPVGSPEQGERIHTHQAPAPGAPPTETRTHETDHQTYGARSHSRCGRGAGREHGNRLGRRHHDSHLQRTTSDLRAQSGPANGPRHAGDAEEQLAGDSRRPPVLASH